MTMRQIKNEGIGDSLKAAGSYAAGLAGAATGTLAQGFTRAIGFDASQPEVGSFQENQAKRKFIGTFVQKINGFISATEEAFKDDLEKLQKIQQQQQQQQQAGVQRESSEFENLYRRILNEDQAIDNHIQQYSSIIANAITQYMSGQVGNLGTTIQNTSKTIVNKIINKQNYAIDLQNLGAAIFDQYYTGQRRNFVQSHPLADTPLSSDAEQVLIALKNLSKKEQEIVVQKLQKGGNLY